MNVWSLDKDVKIKAFLIELINRYGENTFAYCERENNYQAVEIFRNDQPELRAYIYTFAQRRERYAVDLKFPFAENNIIGANESLSLEQLFSIIHIHFDL